MKTRRGFLIESFGMTVAITALPILRNKDVWVGEWTPIQGDIISIRHRNGDEGAYGSRHQAIICSTLSKNTRPIYVKCVPSHPGKPTIVRIHTPGMYSADYHMGEAVISGEYSMWIGLHESSMKKVDIQPGKEVKFEFCNGIPFRSVKIEVLRNKA